MKSRVALIAIIVENPECSAKVNDILHEYGDYIIGRMGIPYRGRGINIISIAIDAPQEITNALSGKLGRIESASVKTVYSNVINDEEENKNES